MPAIPAEEVFEYLKRRAEGAAGQAAEAAQDRVIVFDVEALDDLERIFEFNFERDPATALEHIDRVRSAVLILDAHPEIGRPAGRGSSLRELIISHGKTGYARALRVLAASRSSSASSPSGASARPVTAGGDRAV